MNNECLTKDVIYQATVQSSDTSEIETYIGLTSKTFKERWNNHKTSFRLENHQNESKLSVHIWDLKRQQIDYELKWRIIAKTNSYSPSSKKCWLCVKEKYYILFEPKMATLNKRHEFFTPCLHKAKFKLNKQK